MSTFSRSFFGGRVAMAHGCTPRPSGHRDDARPTVPLRGVVAVAMGLGVSLVSGCHHRGPAPVGAGATLHQQDVCEVHDWPRHVVAAACVPGEKVAFLPDRWGNEQLPIDFAAVNCDLRYSVVLTNGGVTCIDRAP